jgi:hypothetical protein
MSELNPDDTFNVTIIVELNKLLTSRCPYLTFFYEKKLVKRGKFSRKIGVYYNKKVGDVVYKDVEVSYIELDANLFGTELPILYSSTVDDMEIKFNKRKLNLCLRLLAGMIASTENVGLSSVAVNPISLYTMVKYFNCTIKKHGEDADSSECNTLEKCISFMEQTNDSDEENDFNSDAVSISIKTTVPDYHDMLEKLMNLINTGINCVGLGGTRKRKSHKRLRNRKFSRKLVGFVTNS